MLLFIGQKINFTVCQTQAGNQNCEVCTGGQTTLEEGATSVEDCQCESGDELINGRCNAVCPGKSFADNVTSFVEYVGCNENGKRATFEFKELCRGNGYDFKIAYAEEVGEYRFVLRGVKPSFFSLDIEQNDYAPGDTISVNLEFDVQSSDELRTFVEGVQWPMSCKLRFHSLVQGKHGPLSLGSHC